MTREEKIALLIDELEDIRCDNFDADTDEDKTLKEVVRVIKALEQEPILDKIRSEIEELNVLRFSSGERIYKDEVLEIIDKYKAEGEDK